MNSLTGTKMGNEMKPASIPNSSNREQRVLIAIDNSESAEYAFNYLANIHKPEHQIIFGHCTKPISTADIEVDTYFGSHSVPGDKYVALMDAKRAALRKLADRYICLLGDKQIQYKIHAAEFGGNPGEAIIRIADDEKADMIVIGSKNSVSPSLLGKVSGYVVQHASCSVLVCHERGFYKSDGNKRVSGLRLRRNTNSPVQDFDSDA
jgi:nucleotide-binding universal stress UspA family protein